MIEVAAEPWSSMNIQFSPSFCMVRQGHNISDNLTGCALAG
jgi:hypothetical protein